MTIRALICDELPVVRDGMRTLLDAVPDIDVIETTDNGMEAIVLVRTARPDVVVTDLNLRTISGLEMIRRLGKEGQQVMPLDAALKMLADEAIPPDLRRMKQAQAA